MITSADPSSHAKWIRNIISKYLTFQWQYLVRFIKLLKICSKNISKYVLFRQTSCESGIFNSLKQWIVVWSNIISHDLNPCRLIFYGISYNKHQWNLNIKDSKLSSNKCILRTSWVMAKDGTHWIIYIPRTAMRIIMVPWYTLICKVHCVDTRMQKHLQRLHPGLRSSFLYHISCHIVKSHTV